MRPNTRRSSEESAAAKGLGLGVRVSVSVRVRIDTAIRARCDAPRFVRVSRRVWAGVSGARALPPYSLMSSSTRSRLRQGWGFSVSGFRIGPSPVTLDAFAPERRQHARHDEHPAQSAGAALVPARAARADRDVTSRHTNKC